jgi:alkyl hydroperoxide reductase subunit AhpC
MICCAIIDVKPGVSTDSEYSHLAWMNLPRKEGGLGPNFTLPLLADRNMRMSREYGVLIEDKGIALRGLFIIDPKGIVRYADCSLSPMRATRLYITTDR